ncbi:MAG TPA: phosphohistidine phosphatase SixA [Chthoniobacterales bacterium]
MRLYFLRHGEADWPDWEGRDDDRPLTAGGREEMHEVGQFLVRLKVRVDFVLTSPLPRAAQTADIAAQHIKASVRRENLLAPGFRPRQLEQILAAQRGENLLLVGHEPDFSEVIRALTGGRAKMSKAGLALLEVSGTEGKLLWLFPPKVAKA